MAKIKVMDTHLANMIAAGEVVERPAGIVKELVENALDAHASFIEIHIHDGGMQEITVIDNGDGMDGDDLRHAFQRHSTSKVGQSNDLNHLTTFGFRGEALPSIASVSLVKANTHDGQAGHEIEIDNGQEVHFGRFARNKGTTISVYQLFSKVPARLKYIKNIRYEYAIILEIVQKFAMTHPAISFLLVNEGKESFRTHGSGQTKDVFLAVYGNSVAEDVKAFENETYDFSVSGLCAVPQHSRSHRNAIWITLNGRMVRIPKVQNAVIEAYKRYLAMGRFPIAVVDIRVDPQLADVNVHPSKWEVRLSKEQDLIQLILNTVETCLNTQTLTARIIRSEPVQEQISFKQEMVDPKPIILAVEEEPRTVFEPISNDVIIQEEPVYEEAQPRIEALTVLSQMSGRYILAQGDSGLYIVDQHAAMERIRYEYYQERLLHQDYPTQALLMPILLEGRQKAIARLSELKQIFDAVQIQLEQLDPTSLVVREIPIWIKDTDVKGFAEEVLDAFEEERRIDVESMRRRSIATLACHSSIRFNEYLSKDEMQNLIEDLRSCQQPFHCPHGRPTLILMDHKTLEREFKR